MPSPALLGIDVGGTKIRAGIVFPQGKAGMTVEIPTDTAAGNNQIIKNILLAATLVLKNSKTKPKMAGVGMAGIVDKKKNVFVSGPNFPKTFQNVAIGSVLRTYLKMPVMIDNDVHCFTLAEQKFGAAKRKNTVVGLTLGTGIGGGIVVNGQVLRGRNNATGEFGHMTINKGSNAVCGCGMTGHFEALASGSAMRRLYKTRTGRDEAPIEVERRALAGEKEATDVLATVSASLADGIAAIIHALNPDMVVVGGGLAKADAVWNPMLQHLPQAIALPALRDTPVVRAKLGADAGIIGAATMTN